MTNEPKMQDREPAPTEDPAVAESAPEGPEEVMRAAATRITELETEKESLRDRWMRAEAETANVRVRTRREVEETRLFAVQKFAADMAEVAENLRRGLESMAKPEADEPEVVRRLREGFAGVERGMLAALEKNGIRRQDPTGAVFDPNLHEAMAERQSAEHPPGTVLSAWTGAWTLNGRLIRPAMVVVAKVPPTEGPASAEARAGSGGTAGGGPNFDTTA